MSTDNINRLSLSLSLNGSTKVESVSPFPQGDNGDRKDDYIVDCPNLIQPLFPYSRFSSTGKWAIRDVGMAIGILGNRAKRDVKERRHLQNKLQWKCVSSSREEMQIIP